MNIGYGATCSIKGKLAAALGSVLVLIIALGALSHYSQERIGHSILLLDSQVEKMKHISNLQLAINLAVMPANDYIITGNPDYRREFERLNAEVEKEFATIKTSRYFTRDEKVVIGKSETLYSGLREVSRRILVSSHRDAALPALMEKMDYEFGAPAVEAIAGLKNGITSSLDHTRREVDSVHRSTRSIGTAAVIIAIITAMIFGTAISRSVTRPIRETVEALGAAAGGDITGTVRLASGGEFKILSDRFNSFLVSIRGIITSIAGTARKINTVADSTRMSAQSLNESAKNQLKTLEETASGLEEMHFSIMSVSEDAREMLKLAKASSDQAAAISAEISEIAGTAEGLDALRDQTASSIAEIAAATGEIGNNVDTLFSRTEQIVNTVTEMDATISGITAQSKEQAELSRKVREDAAGFGMSTVRGSREAIEKIGDEISATAAVINRLGDMSGEIGKIVDVINNIAGFTNLLSLNAAILAAQAGIHGKPFAVVAGEIKALAGQTAASTKEISALVGRVRDEVASSVASVNTTLTSVEEGVNRSREAESSLARIIDAAESSLEKAQDIEVSLSEQSIGISQVLNMMLDVNDMVMEIKKATDEERVAIHDILTGTEKLEDYTRHISSSTLEQSNGSRALSELINEATERMEAVTLAVAEQEQATERIVLSLATTREETENNVRMAGDLDKLIKILENEGETLQAGVAKFTL